MSPRMPRVSPGTPGARRPAVRLVQACVVGALLAASLLRLPTTQVHANNQVQTFRARIDLVQLDVSVVDQQGQPVRGLTAPDFTVLKDERPEPVVAFAAIDVPTWTAGTATWVRDIGPDVASNRADARRAVVILMDDCSTSWNPGTTRVAKSIANAAIDGLGPSDLAAVVYVFNRRLGQEFTNDRVRLRAAVEQFVSWFVDSRESSPFAASKPGTGFEIPSRMSLPSGACNGHPVAQALRNVGEILGGWPGARKTVVLICPGAPPSGIDELADEEPKLMFAALQNANVNVYQFDPNGLQTAHQTSSDFGTFAENTGGRAITNTNAPEVLVPEMFRENSSYYMLGVASNDSHDGRFHRIKVEVNRPGVRVRARAGYRASLDRPPAKSMELSAMERALSGGLPAGDMAVSVSAAPFATVGKPGAALALTARLDHDENLKGEAVIEVVAAAFNSNWKQVAGATQQFRLPPSNAGVRFSETALRLDLPPGRYEVRTGMRSTADNRTGSVYASVTVPDFAREPLAVSGIVVERGSSGAVMPKNLAVVPVRTTTVRTFSPDDRVAVVARIYQRRAKSITPARVIARVTDGQDRQAFTAGATLQPSAFDAQRQADCRLDLPLGTLADGEYLLMLDVTTGAASARRTLRFSVRR